METLSVQKVRVVFMYKYKLYWSKSWFTLLIKRQLLMYLEIFQYTSIRNLLLMRSNQFLFPWVVT